MTYQLHEYDVVIVGDQQHIVIDRNEETCELELCEVHSYGIDECGPNGHGYIGRKRIDFAEEELDALAAACKI